MTSLRGFWTAGAAYDDILERVEIAAFKKTVWAHYAAQGRHDMAWRTKITPYRIFVSEVMLQQTQVPRVTEKFPAFMAAFPSFRALAASPLCDVLSAWQGMGYNRRAMYLKRAAERIVAEHGGKLPQDTAALEDLPGIGPATARSIAAFAWNSPEVFIETNVRSVFLHHFFPGRSGVSDGMLVSLVEKALDRERPREWYWALMDYGTHLKREVGNPSRSAKGHTKAKPFKGSDREVRGKIVKFLAGGKSGSAASIAKVAGVAPGRVASNLENLVREGMVRRRGKGFTIA